MSAPAASRGALPLPPPEYSQQYQNALIRQLETIIRQITNPGPFICAPDLSSDSRANSGLRILNPPVSTTGTPPSGLTSGDVWADASGSATAFVGTGSISGGTMTITAVTSGTLAVGQGITGTNVPRSTRIKSLGTGTGGTGTYILNETFTAASTTLTAFTSPVLRIVP
jgi:hypothetical protein